MMAAQAQPGSTLTLAATSSASSGASATKASVNRRGGSAARLAGRRVRRMSAVNSVTRFPPSASRLNLQES